MPNLVKFVTHLTDKIHTEVTDSIVIWFDSVICNGKLEWQNEVNDENK